ncbi:MAG: ParB/RepB/Spo0J family partition protein, partial [Oscillospiraceae bacterium]
MNSMNGIFKTKERSAGRVVLIETGLIRPNRSQPRLDFDERELQSLSESIRENGILQPVCVRKNGALYEIISGERRTRAAKLAGLSEIPCIVMEADDEKSAVLALIENIQRKNLSYFEEALAIEKLITVYGLTQENAAARLGKAQSTIANKLRLLRFTDEERMLLLNGSLSERQARAVIRIDDVSARKKALRTIIARHYNVDQTEQYISGLLSEKPEKKKQTGNNSIFKQFK